MSSACKAQRFRDFCFTFLPFLPWSQRFFLWTKEFLTIKAIVDFCALFLTKTATDLISIVTSSNSKKTQQTVVQECQLAPDTRDTAPVFGWLMHVSPSICNRMCEDSLWSLARRFAALSQLSHAVKYQGKPLGPGYSISGRACKAVYKVVDVLSMCA